MYDLSPMMRKDPIYLDYNATTPCAREAVAAMLPFLGSDFGNASSPHRMGKMADAAVSDARAIVAKCIGCETEELFFTSGATESNNLVLLGVTSHSPERRRIVLTEIEHKSVHEPCRWLAEKGLEVVEIPVTSDGVADIDIARQVIDEETLLVCIHGANNEIGTIQPVAAVASIARDFGALIHCDATQMLGKVPVSVDELGVDFASFSGHKAYGPKGVGALFVRRGTYARSIRPTYRGGGQERGLRPGTHNVPGIVGMAVACQLANDRRDSDRIATKKMRDAFEKAITSGVANAKANAGQVDRLPGTSSITLPGVPASMLIANLPHLCIGDGSACSSGAPEPSRVLLAIGLSRDDADCTVRVSFGRGNSDTDGDEAAAAIASAATRIRTKLA